MDFGKWIMVAFISFAFFIGTLVVVCFRQEIGLVSKNYYQDELNHQQKIIQKANANELHISPVISVEAESVNVFFPEIDRVEGGELNLLRPSDEQLDQKFEWKGSNGEMQRFALGRHDKGLYRASLRWRMSGKDYYIEKLIVI